MAIYACPAGVDMTQELLKLALEALETELSIDWTNNDEFNASAEKMHEAITAIKEALAQTQEPVAWQFMNGSNFRKRRPDDFADLDSDGLPYWKPLYTNLPQRTFVGMTGEEIDSCFEDHGWSPSKDYYPVIKDIEAKLKDKNN
jgi:hypothetical protein